MYLYLDTCRVEQRCISGKSTQQFDQLFIPLCNLICGFSLLLVLSFVFRGFFLGNPNFTKHLIFAVLIT